MSYSINKTKYLLDDEASEFERVLMKFIDRNERDCLVLLVLLYTGARANEALSIRAGDVAQGVVLLRGLKGSDDREVPLPGWLFDRLMRFKPNDGLLFPIGYRRLVQLWETYRPVVKKLHSLRHTFAIRQLRKHGRIDVIKTLLGHRSIQNTMVYANYAHTDEELRRLVI